MSAPGSPRKTEAAPAVADAATPAPSSGKPVRVHVELTEADIPDVIERLPKPDKVAHDAAIAKIDAEIKKLQARTNEIRLELEAVKSGRGKFGEQIKAAKAVYSGIRAEKDNLLQQRNQVTAELKRALDLKDATVKTQRSLRATLKFGSADEFDSAIATLKHEQETRSMSLTDEKRLIKEIEALQQQKLQVAKFTDEQSAVGSHSDAIKDLRARQTAKNAEIDAVQAKLAAQKVVLDELYALNEAENKADQFPVLAAERTAIRTQLDALFARLKDARATFRDENNKYYHNQRLVRFKRDVERRHEEEAKKAAFAAKLADYEAEMAKIHPYQDEMDLADALVVMLESVFAKELKAEAAAKSSKAVETATVVELDGLKPLQRKDEDYMSFGFGATKKKGKKTGPGKKSPGAKKDAKVALALAHLDAFSTIGLVPPATVSALSDAVAAIRAKKQWFAAQTSRPNVVATESVKTTAESKSTESPTKTKTTTTTTTKKTTSKKFNAGDKSAFPSLGGGSGSDASAEAVATTPFAAWGPGIGPVAAANVPAADDFPAVGDDFEANTAVDDATDDFLSAEDFPPVN